MVRNAVYHVVSERSLSSSLHPLLPALNPEVPLPFYPSVFPTVHVSAFFS